MLGAGFGGLKAGFRVGWVGRNCLMLANPVNFNGSPRIIANSR